VGIFKTLQTTAEEEGFDVMVLVMGPAEAAEYAEADREAHGFRDRLAVP
jgi:hypothetical protein